MGKVTTGFSMSLDGFVSGPNHDVQQVFSWFGMGDTDYTFPSGAFTLKVSPQSADMLTQAMQSAGVLVTGRNIFDGTQGWGGRHPMDVPVIVVTHSIPDDWPNDGKPFTFVTDGVESAIEQAQKIAGDKDVVVGAPSVVKQCLKLGLLDEIHVDLVPFLLGDGVRLFDETPVAMEIVRVIEGTGVTHLTYRIMK